MLNKRTREEVRQYDMFKLAILIILILLLLIFWLTFQRAGGTSVGQAVTATLIPATQISLDGIPNKERLSVGEIPISGTATPNSEIEVVLNGQALGRIRVGTDGKWSYRLPLPVVGSSLLQIRPIGDPDNASATVSLNVIAPPSLTATTVATVTPTTAPATVTSVSTTVPSTPTRAATPTVALTPTALASSSAPPSVRLPTGTIKPGEITLNGTAAPNSNVEVLLDGRLTGITRSDTSGNWAFKLNLLTGGIYQVVARTGGANPLVTTATLEVEAAQETARIAPALDPTTGAVSIGELGVTGTAAPNAELDVLSGGNSVGKVKAGADGKWTYPVPIPAPGQYILTARTVGSNPLVSQPVSFTVAIPGPDSIVVPIIDSSSGVREGQLRVSGLGTPQGDLELRLNGSPVSTVKAASNGSWQFNVSLPNPGTYIIVVKAIRPYELESKPLNLTIS
jgi:hypothetical protein